MRESDIAICAEVFQLIPQNVKTPEKFGVISSSLGADTAIISITTKELSHEYTLYFTLFP